MLSRSQFVIHVYHPGRANVSKDELRTKLSETFKAEKDSVSVFGFKTKFGGGESIGYGLIYKSVADAKRFEPKYRLIRNNLLKKDEKPSRKQRKINKNKGKKIRGTLKRHQKRLAKRNTN